jgi:hypothetical protein
MGSFITPVNNPNTILSDGQVVDITNWLTNFNTIYNFVNASLVAQFNLMNYAGDLITNNGASVSVLTTNGVTNGYVLSKNTGAPNGIQWISPPGLPTTTEGDMLYYTSGSNARLAIGANGTVLTSNGTDPVWGSGPAGVPSGCILLWSGTIATIPSGWNLCNGLNGTPNLQGYFIVGAGNASPPGPNGLGLIAPNSQGGDSATGAGVGASYSPGVSGSVSGSTGSPSGIANTPNTGAPTAASSSHTHSFSGSFSTAVNAFTVTPVYYSLAYIQKA